jgi:basic amino acid/polyamine antiporter, APA family
VTAAARPLGFWSLFALGLNGIVGVGIFFTPAEIARAAPPGGSVGAFALTALLLAPVALVYARLSRRFEEDGGPVLYARAAFPAWAAFAVGWMAYVSAVLSTASTCVGLAQALVGASGARLGGSLVAAGLAIVCALGIVLSARVWTVLTALKLVPLLVLVAVGVAAAPHAAGATALAQAAPAAALGGGSWLGAALLATFAFQGFEIVPVVAGQVKAVGKIVPLATVASLGAATLLYLVLQSVAVRALGDELGASEAPLADAAGAVGGDTLRALLTWGTSLSALGIAFGMISMTPRYLAALAAQESLAGRLHEMTSGVPRRALLVTVVLVVGLAVAFGAHLDQLLVMSSVAVLCQFASAAAALGWMSLRRVHGFVPKDGWLAIPALITPAMLVANGSRAEWTTAGGALVLGYVLRRVSRR